MELVKAKESLTALLEEHRRIFSNFDIKYSADVYLADSKTFASRTDDDPFATVLCASITISLPDAKDENEMCGFDIILNLNKKKEVNDEEFEREAEEFKSNLNLFLSELEDAKDLKEFIKSKAKKEKEAFNIEMEGYAKKMKKAKILIATISALILISLVLTAFAVLLN